jgi:hypothetical protein
MRYAIVAFQDENVFNGIINISLTTVSLSVMAQVASLAWNSKEITQTLGELHKLHDRHNNEQIQVLSKKCFRIAKCHLCLVMIAAFIVSVMAVAGLQHFKLIFPVIYDVFATGPLYYVLIAANLFHMVIVAATIVACDLLPSFCVARIEKNQSLVAHDFEHCADSVDRKNNEKSVKAGIKYYAAIRR